MSSYPNSEKQVNICFLFTQADRNSAHILDQARCFSVIVDVSKPRTHASLFLPLRTYSHPNTSTLTQCSCPICLLRTCFLFHFMLSGVFSYLLIDHRHFEVTSSVFADWNEFAIRNKPRRECSALGKQVIPINCLPSLCSQPCPSSSLVYWQTQWTCSIQTMCSNLYLEKLPSHCFQRFPYCQAKELSAALWANRTQIPHLSGTCELITPRQ